MNVIGVRGATLHNLRDVDVDFPKDALTVVTGVSGSGKSTLVFDVLHEAGRRAYLQAIGVLDGLDAGGCRAIDGLCPTVAVRQRTVRHANPRSVVGTRTRALHHLGVAFADASNRQEGVADRLPAHFSFNSPSGMCTACEGRGHRFVLDFDVLLPREDTTLAEMYRRCASESAFRKRTVDLAREHDVDLDRPFRSLPEAVRELVLYGRGPRGRERVGLEEHLRQRLIHGKGVSNAMRAERCPACDGHRLNAEALAVRIAGHHVGELGRMTASRLVDALRDVRSALDERTGTGRSLASAACAEASAVAEQLVASSLGHLSLHRPVPTLSGGETQRLYLMSFLTSGMSPLAYLFDEPTAGLHESEKAALVERLRALRARGNTVIVVEHDPGTVAAADHVVDIGPLAGPEGGRVVHAGSRAGLLRCAASPTGRHLAAPSGPAARARRAAVDGSTPALRIRGARTNNLRGLSVDVPLGALVGVAGVSGSGKSSLVAGTLVPALAEHLSGGASAADDDDPEVGVELRSRPRFDRIEGMEGVDRVVDVGQSPIGRSSSSIVGTYLGIWDRVRRHLASLPVARERGYTPGHFSFNSLGGCSACRGAGRCEVQLGATSVAYPCERCGGGRYEAEVLDVTWRGHGVADLLSMPARDALELFADDAAIARALGILVETGLGYVAVGRSTASLSGGEAQRLKLSKEIGRPHGAGRTLYVLDEPTTGLSPFDTDRLIAMLDELVAGGQSVIVIEHDPTVLSCCDWLIEIGPGGGNDGGELVAVGSPAELRKGPSSLIGPHLLV